MYNGTKKKLHNFWLIEKKVVFIYNEISKKRSSFVTLFSQGSKEGQKDISIATENVQTFYTNIILITFYFVFYRK